MATAKTTPISASTARQLASSRRRPPGNNSNCRERVRRTRMMGISPPPKNSITMPMSGVSPKTALKAMEASENRNPNPVNRYCWYRHMPK